MRESEKALIPNPNEPLDPREWEIDDWKIFWTKTLGTNQPLAVPEITKDFYFNAFIEIQEAETPERLQEIKRDWSDLLDDKSPDAISILTDPQLPDHQRRAAYLVLTNFIHNVGVYGNIDSNWSTSSLKIENDPNKRFWAINAKYQFAKDNEDLEWRTGKTNDSRVGGNKILCYMVGIFENDIILNNMINNPEKRKKIIKSKKPLDRFTSLCYFIREGIEDVDSPELSDVIADGLKYLENNFPNGYTFAQLNQKYPIFFEWLKIQLSLIDQKTLESGTLSLDRGKRSYSK